MDNMPELGQNIEQIVKSIKQSGHIEDYLKPEIMQNYRIPPEDIVDLIIASGHMENYITTDLKDKFLMPHKYIIRLIEKSGHINDYLTKEKIEQFDISRRDIVKLIIARGQVEYYLAHPELLQQFKIEGSDAVKLIEKSGNIKSYLSPESLKKYKIFGSDAVKLIKKSENIESYLNPETLQQLNIYERDAANLIKASKNIRKYLTLDNVREFIISEEDIIELIIESGDIEYYLDDSKTLKKFGLDEFDITELIIECGNVKKYLEPETLKKFGITGENAVALIKESGKIEEYLNPETLEKFGITGKDTVELIKASGKIEEYLNPETLEKFGITGKDTADLIKASGKIEEYLNPETLGKFGIAGKDAAYLIEASGNIDAYASVELLKKLGIYGSDAANLIKKVWNIDSYINEDTLNQLEMSGNDATELIKASWKTASYITKDTMKKFGMSGSNMADLIIATGNATKYLTLENVQQFEMYGSAAVKLIIASKNEKEYIKPEIMHQFGISGSNAATLILLSENKESYLTPESVKEYNLRGKDILDIAGLGRYSDEAISGEIDRELDNGTYTYESILRLKKIAKSIEESNSGRLNKISGKIIGQIMETPIDRQQEVAERIRRIYETQDIPEFAQNFLVFKYMHPSFLGDGTQKFEENEAIGNIPSLSSATPIQRKNIIFSDLLKIAVESNSRNLKGYLDTIEQGDRMFEMFKAGKLQLDDTMSRDDRAVLIRYSEMLNTLYNQTSKGRRLDEARKNSGNLEQDLTELNALFEDDKNVHMPLRDRIVRTFGYWAGIRDFEQAKGLIEEVTRQADERNRKNALYHSFAINKGDFAKGIESTEYFPNMLQSGIVAKDYLGESASHDFTPLDTDVELITSDEKILIASGYAKENENGKALGRIIIVIKNNENYVKTREGLDVDEDAVRSVIEDKTKIEYFDNQAQVRKNAYGIRTGIGSTHISFIIADRYVDKLGLEIAMNGFYIPIVDKEKNLLYTPEMYDEIRSRMQGLSHYGLTEFTLDPSARNIGTENIIQVVEASRRDAENKRSKIMSTLREAIQAYGLNMSDKRTKDLLNGTVEVIDTGSTGRGTNLPGDGDFDFMVRLDSQIFSNPEQFKKMVSTALESKEKTEEKLITRNGDFRFKGVSVEGLNERVDLDLSFTKRTDEIEYTTEECINDRLETIRKKNPEDYKYVVANILLAKTVLKSAGAYKKSSSPEPQKGEKDTRGGLGAVGIENWILQNGGSFEKAARDFLAVAESCNELSEFQKRYAIWDFGENYMSGDNYSHDNFVNNMNENGYSIMVKTLEDYVRTIENECTTKVETKSLGDIVREDVSVLNTTYMEAVKKILIHARSIEREKQETVVR